MENFGIKTRDLLTHPPAPTPKEPPQWLFLQKLSPSALSKVVDVPGCEESYVYFLPLGQAEANTTSSNIIFN